jgi:hypothetical protein
MFFMNGESVVMNRSMSLDDEHEPFEEVNLGAGSGAVSSQVGL